jgi:iron uptake system component EfeO
MKNFKKLSTLLIVPALAGTLAACGNSDKTASVAQKTNQDTVQSSNPVKAETKKLQDITEQLINAINSKDQTKVKEIGAYMNDQWLSYENEVRDHFPLFYAKVERYEQPIFAQSTMASSDFSKLKDDALSLKKTLADLQTAKETESKTSAVLNQAVANYKSYVVGQTNQLVQSTQAFADAVNSGNINEAKSLYSKTRVYYERIEPIAESFGDLDPRIDARINDVDDSSKWTGFHEIEKALWEDNSLEGQKKYADQLVSDVNELQSKVKSINLKPKAMVAGAMDLLSEAATSKITGEEERYSHVDLMDFQANIEGSEAVYQASIPALNKSNKDLAKQIDNQFQKIDNELLKYQTNGEFISYQEFEKNPDQVRQLSDDLQELSKLMAQTASIF